MVTLTFQMKGAVPFQHGFPDDCEILIGRGASSEPATVTNIGRRHVVRLPLPTLSEEHAMVTVSGGAATITDRKSKNGTLVRLAVGVAHALRESPVSLGSDVTVFVEGSRRGLPDGLGRMSPDALCDVLRSTLASDAVQVTLGPRGECSFPLEGDRRHLTLIPRTDQTLATDDVDWVRAVVNGYNAAVDQQRTEQRWRFVARSTRRQAVLEQALAAAPSAVPVLLVGPLGSGRGVLAEDLHENGRRGGGPFVTVDCTATGSEETERRIFGRGDGEGEDDATHAGDLEYADGGTLFLREVDALSLTAQTRLVHFLNSDTGCFERVGDLRTRNARVRLIASTRVNLAEQVAAKRFREDLLDRLQGIKIAVPAPDAADLDAITMALFQEAQRLGSTLPPPDQLHAIAAEAGRYAWTQGGRDLSVCVDRCLKAEAPETNTPWSERWRRAMAAHAASSGADQLKELAVQPAVIGRLLADILFLSIAARVRTRTELAARVHMTFQGADARMDALGVSAGDTSAINRRLQQAVVEFRGCVQHDPALAMLLESLPRV